MPSAFSRLTESIRNLEAAIAAKRAALNSRRDSNFVFRLLGGRKPEARARQSSVLLHRWSGDLSANCRLFLFKLKRDYRASHKRYSQIHGFTGYANRIAHSSSQRQRPSRHSDCVLCQDLPSALHVRGRILARKISKTAVPSPSSISMPYTQSIPDPDRKLFFYLVAVHSTAARQMKILDSLLCAFCLGGALAGYFWMEPPSSYLAIGLCGGFVVGRCFLPTIRERLLCGSEESHGRWRILFAGWLITGRTGSRENAVSHQCTHFPDLPECHAIGAAFVSIRRALLGNSRQDGCSFRAQ